MSQQELSGGRIFAGTVQGLATAILGLFVDLALARSMEFEVFGEFSAARGVLRIASVLCSLGMGALATKIYRDISTEEHRYKARGLRLAGPILILVISAATYAALVASHTLIHERTAVRLTSFVAVLALLPLLCLRSFFKSSAAAHGAAVAASALNGWLARISFLLLIAAALYLWKFPLGILAISAAWAVNAILVLVGLWILVLWVEPGYLHRGIRKYEIGGWLRAGIAFALTSLGLTIIDDGGVVVLGWVHANAGAAARLSAASALGTVLLATAINVRGIFAPVLVEAILRRDAPGVHRIFRLWFRRISMAVVPMAAAMIATAPWLLHSFGAKFEGAYWTLIVYVANYLIGSVNLLFVVLYQYMGHERSAGLIMLGAAVIAVVGMVVLGAFWQDLGIATAVALSVNGAVLLMAWLGWRELRTWDSKPS